MSKFDPYEHLKIIKNQDGTLTRLIKFPQIPASGDGDGQTVVTKDVTLDVTKHTWLRIFRPSKIPSNDNKISRLPLIIYFHGGGWINFHVSDALIHETMTKLSHQIPAITVAVNYRLAPETRLPGQYDDALDALTWIQNQALDPTAPTGDTWITEYADLSRVYLYGNSCGANIALHTALRVINENLTPLTIAGVILCQPLIGGKKRTKSELKLAADTLFPLPVIDLLWELALPIGTDRDHRFCNPLMDEQVKEKMRRLGRCLVIGFGGDPLIDRQQELVQVMVMEGVVVEARFDDVGFHGIEIVDPRRASAILNFVKEFIV